MAIGITVGVSVFFLAAITSFLCAQSKRNGRIFDF